MRETLFLGRDDVRGLLTMEMALEVVEKAFAAHGRGETRMPAKIYLDLPEVGGDFRGDDAEVFMPEDQGGDTAKALDLLTALFASRGDTASVPADVLDGMRAQIVSTRGDI